MKVIVNQDACIGCGACTSICEEAFEIDAGNGLSTCKIKGEIPVELEQSVKDAMDSCPTGAIVLAEGEGSQEPIAEAA